MESNFFLHTLGCAIIWFAVNYKREEDNPVRILFSIDWFVAFISIVVAFILIKT